MCTLTIVRHDGRTLVACSRDEQRTRPAAMPPTLQRLAGVMAISPIDPVAGGTWIAATEQGLVFAVLNANDGRPRSSGPSTSRGLIIPSIAGALNVRQALAGLCVGETGSTPPFRVIACDGRELAVAAGGWGRVEVLEVGPLDRPRVFCSSGLGDERVRGPRERLWAQTLAGSPCPLVAQRSFHRHRWHEAGWLSVDMTREDARTVSLTTVELGPEAVTVRHVPRHEDGWGEVVGMKMALAAGRAW
jgi:Transport and Golgi organisation 2